MTPPAAPRRVATAHPRDTVQDPAGVPSTALAAAARRTMQALDEGSDVWEQFFEHVPLGLALADLTSRYLRLNPAYAALLGQSREDMIGTPFLGLVHRQEDVPDESLLAELVSGRRPDHRGEQRYVGPGGREAWVLHTVSLVRSDDGAPQWFALTAQDVSEQRRTEQELRDLTAVLTERAVRDPLTGLANRTLVEERLRGALARDARTGGTSGVLFLDVDGFKAVNDRFGHAVGDAVLQTFAARLTACVRPSDTVARLGGDEFLVLAEGTSQAGLQPLVQRLADALAEPVEVGTLTLQVGVSVGLAVSAGGEADAAGLIEAADQAMYSVKRDGRLQR